MLVDEHNCDQSSHTETYEAGRPNTQQSHVEDNSQLCENNSVRANLPTLSPEDTTNHGLVDNADVGAVVGKAKKAAQFLWLLIHAQNCSLGGDRCPHKGCTEAKTVLLHIKTCPAESTGETCPSNYSGCHQARKLLSHHTRCREIRAKQAGMGRRQNKEQYACLICSMVARHAKTMLDVTSRKNNAKKQVITSFTVAKEQDMNCRNISMPPPPPRQRPPGNRWSPNSDSSTEELSAGNHLTHLREAATAASVSQNLGNNKSPFLEFAATTLHNLRRASPNEDDSEEPMGQCRSPRRLRAESYDERALKHRQEYSKKDLDPTLELDLKGEEQFVAERMVRRTPLSRRRSASLSILASACEGHIRSNCDKIVEEGTDAKYVPVHHESHYTSFDH